MTPLDLQRPHRKRFRRFLRGLVLLVLVYGAAAYLAIPEIWRVVNDVASGPSNEMVTRTPDGTAGDPINVGLVGSKQDVLRAFAAAKWDTADPITLKSSLEIGGSVLFDHPYPDAPVSTLLFEGRQQDLAFEKPVGSSADQRQHVRFWQTPEVDSNNRPLWLGSASFDQGVGFSHDTGQVTHHIGPDVDAERDKLIADLERAGRIGSTYEIEGVGATRDGRNGGGDLYFTDGKARVGVLRPLPAL